MNNSIIHHHKTKMSGINFPELSRTFREFIESDLYVSNTENAVELYKTLSVITRKLVSNDLNAFNDIIKHITQLQIDCASVIFSHTMFWNLVDSGRITPKMNVRIDVPRTEIIDGIEYSKVELSDPNSHFQGEPRVSLTDQCFIPDEERMYRKFPDGTVNMVRVQYVDDYFVIVCSVYL